MYIDEKKVLVLLSCVGACGGIVLGSSARFNYSFCKIHALRGMFSLQGVFYSIDNDG